MLTVFTSVDDFDAYANVTTISNFTSAVAVVIYVDLFTSIFAAVVAVDIDVADFTAAASVANLTDIDDVDAF